MANISLFVTVCLFIVAAGSFWTGPVSHIVGTFWLVVSAGASALVSGLLAREECLESRARYESLAWEEQQRLDSIDLDREGREWLEAQKAEEAKAVNRAWRLEAEKLQDHWASAGVEISLEDAMEELEFRGFEPDLYSV